MEAHDIIYIDVPRFESLASQRLSGLTQSRIISELVSKEKLSASEAERRALQETGSHTTGMTRQVDVLDSSFREFMEAIKNDIVEITADVSTSRASCEQALLTSQFVRARGPFFYNDFRWLKNFSSVWSKGQEALHKMTPPTKEERATFDGIKKTLSHTWAIMDFGFSDSIECGVALGQPDSGLLVKAVLDRTHLRCDSASFIDRYGTKTQCNFTVLGTVARVGWQGQVDIIDRLTAGADEGMQVFKKSIEATQEMAVNIRRNASGGEEHSVHLMPLAVYRSSTFRVEEAATS